MCNSQNIEQEVIKIIADNIDPCNIKLNGGITEKSRLKFDLGVSSRDLGMIVLKLESEFEIYLSDEFLGKYVDEISVSDLVYEVKKAIREL